MSAFIAKVPSNGKSKKVVAVLLVNSVNKEVKKVRKKIVKSKPNCFKNIMFLDNSFANPVSITKEAIDNPPPNKIKTFQGMLLNQSIPRITSIFLFTGKIKNKIAQDKAIPESFRLRSKRLLIFILNIQSKAANININSETFSLLENLPRDSYFNFNFD